MTYIFRAIWPVLNLDRSFQSLITEATRDVPRLATQAHALITGPGRWYIAPSHTIPGAGGRSNQVLVHEAPAQPMRQRIYHHNNNQGAHTA